MDESNDHRIYFYSRHPISYEIICKKLIEAHGRLDGRAPEDLWPFDQDHYGGLIANDELAHAAGIRRDDKVADFCAGLGGPARYVAHRYGAAVTGIELTPARVDGANKLNKLVGLDGRVQVLNGDVMAAPLPDAAMDVVVSQEAFLHVPDKARVLAEAFRVLKPGGRIAFTDWALHRPMSEADAALMWEGLAAQSLLSADEYRQRVADAGFSDITVIDLTTWWGEILAERLAMYQKLRREAEAAGTAAGHDAFHRSYIRFVALMQERTLGGVRVSARKPA